MPNFRDRTTQIILALVVAVAAYIVFGTHLVRAADKGGPVPGVTRAEADAMFPANPWTAVYAGLGIGTGALTSDYGLGIDGYQVSGRLGADVQISRIVVGIFADLAWDHTTILGNTNPREYGVGARAGFLVTNDVLLYGAVSERWLQVSGLNTQGIDLAAGLEVASARNWRLGMEYNHVAYDAIAAAREQTVTGRLIFAFPR